MAKMSALNIEQDSTVYRYGAYAGNRRSICFAGTTGTASNNYRKLCVTYARGINPYAGRINAIFFKRIYRK